MAHVEGVVAHVRFTTPPRETIYDYERDVDGVYVRRRISFSREAQHAHTLPNVIGWLVSLVVLSAAMLTCAETRSCTVRL